MTKKVDQNHSRFRVPGEEGSKQNKLRGQLYDEAFRRIRDGLGDENYFEVIALSESILSDRVGALLQALHHFDEEQYPTESLGVSAHLLRNVLRDRGIKLGNKFNKMLGRVIHWANERNHSIHAFVIVNTGNLDKGVGDRLQQLRVTAERGSIITREFSTLIQGAIDDVKKQQDSRNTDN